MGDSQTLSKKPNRGKRIIAIKTYMTKLSQKAKFEVVVPMGLVNLK